jgi:hypothetical protein
LIMLHHVADNVARHESDLKPIGLASVECGIALGRWLTGETRRIYELLTESSAEHSARQLIDFIRARKGRITVRDLMRANPRRYSVINEAQAALDRLVELGVARWMEGVCQNGGGREPVREPTSDARRNRQNSAATTEPTKGKRQTAEIGAK